MLRMRLITNRYVPSSSTRRLVTSAPPHLHTLMIMGLSFA